MQKNHAATVGEMIQRGCLQRVPAWSEGLAVGDAAYVEALQPEIRQRYACKREALDEESWVLREAGDAYS